MIWIHSFINYTISFFSPSNSSLCPCCFFLKFMAPYSLILSHIYIYKLINATYWGPFRVSYVYVCGVYRCVICICSSVMWCVYLCTCMCICVCDIYDVYVCVICMCLSVVYVCVYACVLRKMSSLMILMFRLENCFNSFCNYIWCFNLNTTMKDGSSRFCF